MRGHADPQGGLFSYVSLERRIPDDHPLRVLKAQVDTALAAMSSDFEAMYSHTGRPSVAGTAAQSNLVDGIALGTF
jgi:transposase